MKNPCRSCILVVVCRASLSCITVKNRCSILKEYLIHKYETKVDADLLIKGVISSTLPYVVRVYIDEIDKVYLVSRNIYKNFHIISCERHL